MIGKYGEPDVKDNGGRLRNFIEVTNLKVMNECFNDEDIYKFALTEPSRGGLLSIIFYKVYQGVELGLYWYLSMAEVVMK